MNKVTYVVHADNPIFARMDVPFRNKELAEDYAQFLEREGYENVKIEEKKDGF